MTDLSPTIFAIILPALVAIAACVAIVWLLFGRLRHQRTLRSLYLAADGMEHDLKACRQRLQRAHASMSVSASRPAAGEADAGHAIDAALRELLAHRLWLRDQAEHASQHELDAAVAAMDQARGALGHQMHELDLAQRALESAVREKIEVLSQRP